MSTREGHERYSDGVGHHVANGMACHADRPSLARCRRRRPTPGAISTGVGVDRPGRRANAHRDLVGRVLGERGRR